jgi:ribosomal protein L12E/L44/L45/RPP1/RPP2
MRDHLEAAPALPGFARGHCIDITTVSLTISQLTDDNMEEAIEGMERPPSNSPTSTST